MAEQVHGEVTSRGGSKAAHAATAHTTSWLLCRAARRFCALPLDAVVETMRPLPVAPVAGAPVFVSGIAIVRGVGLPVVNTAALLGSPESTPGRFVTVRVDEARHVVFAVEAVVGVRTFAPDSFSALPPLLASAGSELVSAIGTLDSELLVVLNRTLVVPDEVWSALAQESGRS